MGSLKEAGLRKLAKALDNAAQNVHALLLDHVAPAAEVATFILGEMKGMAAAARGNQMLGVSVSQFQTEGTGEAKHPLAIDYFSRNRMRMAHSRGHNGW